MSATDDWIEAVVNASDDHITTTEAAQMHGMPDAQKVAVARALCPAGFAVVPVEPTEGMHDAAREWSLVKYGQGIGRDASDGCYRAMLAAAKGNAGEG